MVLCWLTIGFLLKCEFAIGITTLFTPAQVLHRRGLPSNNHNVLIESKYGLSIDF